MNKTCLLSNMSRAGTAPSARSLENALGIPWSFAFPRAGHHSKSALVLLLAVAHSFLPEVHQLVLLFHQLPETCNSTNCDLAQDDAPLQFGIVPVVVNAEFVMQMQPSGAGGEAAPVSKIIAGAAAGATRTTSIRAPSQAASSRSAAAGNYGSTVKTIHGRPQKNSKSNGSAATRTGRGGPPPAASKAVFVWPEAASPPGGGSAQGGSFVPTPPTEDTIMGQNMLKEQQELLSERSSSNSDIRVADEGGGGGADAAGYTGSDHNRDNSRRVLFLTPSFASPEENELRDEQSRIGKLTKTAPVSSSNRVATTPQGEGGGPPDQHQHQGARRPGARTTTDGTSSRLSDHEAALFSPPNHDSSSLAAASSSSSSTRISSSTLPTYYSFPATTTRQNEAPVSTATPPSWSTDELTDGSHAARTASQDQDEKMKKIIDEENLSTTLTSVFVAGAPGVPVVGGIIPKAPTKDAAVLGFENYCEIFFTNLAACLRCCFFLFLFLSIANYAFFDGQLKKVVREKIENGVGVLKKTIAPSWAAAARGTRTARAGDVNKRSTTTTSIGKMKNHVGKSSSRRSNKYNRSHFLKKGTLQQTTVLEPIAELSSEGGGAGLSGPDGESGPPSGRTTTTSAVLGDGMRRNHKLQLLQGTFTSNSAAAGEDEKGGKRQQSSWWSFGKKVLPLTRHLQLSSMVDAV
ncbi:unnamed protein product [Amoebophrya sp. A120]|nr:unnamed protein product [Amoebophrya sp. A120]|eukprot:GSA120T00009986001.1